MVATVLAASSPGLVDGYSAYCKEALRWQRKEKGSYVYQVVADEQVEVLHPHGTGLYFSKGNLVSVDMIMHPYEDDNVAHYVSKDNAMPSSSLLRLSDGSGFLWERKDDQTLLEPVSVDSGLWKWRVDIFPESQQALQRHPTTGRTDLQVVTAPRGAACKENDVAVGYLPSQKVSCDRRVVQSGISYYRVQGTNGWICDRRTTTSDDDEDVLLVEDDQIKTGLFAFCATDTAVVMDFDKESGEKVERSKLLPGQVVLVNIVREESAAEASSSGELWLHLVGESEGAGWVHVPAAQSPCMVPLSIETRPYSFKVLSPTGVRSSLQPMLDHEDKFGGKSYGEGTVIACDCVLEARTSSGMLHFYRVQGSNEWVSDPRRESRRRQLLELGWSPEFVRGVAAPVPGLREILVDDATRWDGAPPSSDDCMISFRQGKSLVHVYYGTRKIEFFADEDVIKDVVVRHNCSPAQLAAILKDPVAYSREAGSSQAEGAASVPPVELCWKSKYADGVSTRSAAGEANSAADSETKLRMKLLACEGYIEKLRNERLEILKSIAICDMKEYGSSAKRLGRDPNTRHIPVMVVKRSQSEPVSQPETDYDTESTSKTASEDGQAPDALPGDESALATSEPAPEEQQDAAKPMEKPEEAAVETAEKAEDEPTSDDTKDEAKEESADEEAKDEPKEVPVDVETEAKQEGDEPSADNADRPADVVEVRTSVPLNRTCGYCFKVFCSSRQRWKHCLEEHGLYSCNYCQDFFHTETDLNRHRDEADHWVGPFGPVGQARDPDAPETKVPTKRVPGGRQCVIVPPKKAATVAEDTGEMLNLTCGQCKETFSSSRERRNHCLTVHSLYSCNYCIEVFGTETALNKHRDKEDHW